MTLDRRGWMAVPLLALGIGCGIAPKSFRKVADPAPIVRARSVSLGQRLPQNRVLPVLIDRLEDRDPVVRLAAFEQLRKDTGQTFGYVPWAGEPDRAKAVARWRAWWRLQQGAPAGTRRNP